jgi:type I restriction enzyme S subunit
MKPGYLCPKGYKQTEVGVIPEEWEVADLQQVCRETITYLYSVI